MKPKQRWTLETLADDGHARGWEPVGAEAAEITVSILNGMEPSSDIHKLHPRTVPAVVFDPLLSTGGDS